MTRWRGATDAGKPIGVENCCRSDQLSDDADVLEQMGSVRGEGGKGRSVGPSLGRGVYVCRIEGRSRDGGSAKTRHTRQNKAIQYGECKVVS